MPKMRPVIRLHLPASFPLDYGLAAILGLLHSASFLSDAAWPIQLVSLAGLIALTTRQHNRWRATNCGFAFGLGWFLSGIAWIYISLHTYGALPAALAAVATFLLCAYLALFPALACALYNACRTRFSSPIATLLLFPSFWTLGEYLRGTLFTGFPWLASGYAHVASPLAGYAAIIGLYGVSLIAAIIAGALMLLGTRQYPRSALCVVLLLPLVGWLLSHINWSQASGKPLRVSLLQGNVPQDLKFIRERFPSIADQYLQLIQQQSADLIVLPETALPRFLHELPPQLLLKLRNHASVIALGIPIVDPGERYTNSVVAFTPQQPTLQRYDKVHLVPFGEFIPWGFHWFVAMMNIPLGDFTQGAHTQAPMTLAGQRIAFNICYEDLFGAEIAQRAASANLLINVSNIAWFGDSLALPQHLQVSRMRAIETARPMLRATNTGMTAAIDAHGHVLAKLAPQTYGALNVTVQGMTGTTPYVRYGDLPIQLLLTAIVIAIFFPRRLKT